MPLLDQKGGDALGAGVRVSLGIDYDQFGLRPVGDPHLAPVEHVAVAAAFGAGAHRDDIRAGLGFAHRQRPHMLTRDQLRQMALALGFGAVQAELVDAQVRVGTVGQPHRSRGTADLFHGDDVGEIAHARPTDLLGHSEAEQA